LPVSNSSPALQKLAVKLDVKRSWHWCNSEEEVDCRSKVVRSKLTVNAIQFANFTETGRHSASDVKLEHTEAGIAQRQSVSNTVLYKQDMQMSEFEDGYRLISGRSQDRNLLPAFHPLVALQKLLVVRRQH
jgi:hypothetical protein